MTNDVTLANVLGKVEAELVKAETFSLDQAVTKLVAAIQETVNQHYAANFTRLTPPTITIEAGRRYIRIVKNESPSSSRSVWGFVDKTNGDILKAEGWKKPAKHARGSVFNANIMDGCDHYGPHYINRNLGA